MKIFILLNKNAGSIENTQKLLDALKDNSNVTIEACETENDVPQLTRRAIAEGYDVLCPGGGDGTIHSVVNSLPKDYLGAICLGLLPLGTGNDFCRSLGIPSDPVEAFNLLSDPTRSIEQRIDVMDTLYSNQKRICVNLASGGFGGEVEKTIDPQLKARWKGLAYARAAVEAARDLKEFRVLVNFDSNPAVELSAISVVVANGVAAGGGFEVAPRADPADGKLDIVIAHNAHTLQLATVAAQLLVGDYTESDHVSHFRAKRVRVQSDPPMHFSIDGSFLAETPLTFTIFPNAVRILTPLQST